VVPPGYLITVDLVDDPYLINLIMIWLMLHT